MAVSVHVLMFCRVDLTSFFIYEDSIFFRNYGTYLQDCTMSEPRVPLYVTTVLKHFITSYFRNIINAGSRVCGSSISRGRTVIAAAPSHRPPILVPVRIFRPPATKCRFRSILRSDVSLREQWSDYKARRMLAARREMQHVTR